MALKLCEIMRNLGPGPQKPYEFKLNLGPGFQNIQNNSNWMRMMIVMMMVMMIVIMMMTMVVISWTVVMGRRWRRTRTRRGRQ